MCVEPRFLSVTDLEGGTTELDLQRGPPSTQLCLLTLRPFPLLLLQLGAWRLLLLLVQL